MAGDLVLIVLEIKLVVIGQLQGKNWLLTGCFLQHTVKVSVTENLLRQERKKTKQKKKPRDQQRLTRGVLPGTPYLFSLWDPAAGNDDDLVFLVERYDLSDAVGSARVVHVAGKRESGRLGRRREPAGIGGRRHSPSWATGQRCVNHLLVVDAEHVDPSVLEEASQSFTVICL